MPFYDAAAERLDTVRPVHMPEAKKATLKAMLTAEVREVLTQRPALTVVKVAEGAKDNWTFLDTLVPEGEARGRHTPAKKGGFSDQFESWIQNYMHIQGGYNDKIK